MNDFEEIQTIKHFEVIKPRYCETDQMGVIYYARYLDWFEVGRTELFKSIGLPYRKLEKKGIFLPVLESNSRYISPAHYDVEIILETTIEKFRHGLIQFNYRITRDDKIIAKGYTKHVFMKDGKKITLNLEDLKNLLETKDES